MRVPSLIYADEALLPQLEEDRAIAQVANAATLPGIVRYAIAMPDIHWGYGFPIGGVAAMRMTDGIISPGAVGYDINCGVRLLATQLDEDDLRPHLRRRGPRPRPRRVAAHPSSQPSTPATKGDVIKDASGGAQETTGHR